MGQEEGPLSPTEISESEYESEAESSAGSVLSAHHVMIQCSKCLSKELTLILSDTRELDRVPSTR